MTNAIIGFPRWTDSIVWSGGAWTADYPPSNLAGLPLSRVARSANADPLSTCLTGLLPTSRGVRLIALVRHNLSRNATIRVRLYRDAAATDLAHDSGALPAWPVVYPFGINEWEDDQYWSGQYATNEIAENTWTRPIWLDRIHLARSIAIDIVDADNPDGHIDLGLIEVAQGWQVGINFDYGAEFGFRFRTQDVESLGGARYHERRAKPRTWRGSIAYLDRDEALARGFEQQRQLDLDQPFLWLPHPAEPVHWLRTVFLARNTNPGALRYAVGDRTSVALSFEEVL